MDGVGIGSTRGVLRRAATPLIGMAPAAALAKDAAARRPAVRSRCRVWRAGRWRRCHINRRGDGARNDGLRLAIILRAQRERKPKQIAWLEEPARYSEGNSFHMFSRP